MTTQHSMTQLTLPGVDDLSEKRIGMLRQAEALVREVLLGMHHSPIDYQVHLRRKMEDIAHLASFGAAQVVSVHIDT